MSSRRPVALRQEDPRVASLQTILRLMDYAERTGNGVERRNRIIATFLAQHGIEVRGARAVDRSGETVRITFAVTVVRRVISEALRLLQSARS